MLFLKITLAQEWEIYWLFLFSHSIMPPFSVNFDGVMPRGPSFSFGLKLAVAPSVMRRVLLHFLCGLCFPVVWLPVIHTCQYKWQCMRLANNPMVTGNHDACTGLQAPAHHKHIVCWHHGLCIWLSQVAKWSSWWPQNCPDSLLNSK